MANELGLILRSARKKQGWSQASLAALMHVSRAAVTQWENGTTSPSTNKLLELSKIFGIDFVLASGSLEDREKGYEETALHNSDLQQKLTSVSTSDVDHGAYIPVRKTEGYFGKGVFGKGKIAPDLRIWDEVIGYVDKPLSVRNVSGVYAFYMATFMLEPRYFLGETVYVNSQQPPARYDYVLAHAQTRFEPGLDHVLVGRFLGYEADGGVILQHHNPEHEYVLDRKSGAVLERIYPWAELLRQR